MTTAAWIRHARTTRGLFALLLACVLMMRAAVPTGFMPTRSAEGIVISLCTGQGAVETLLLLDHTDGTSDRSTHDQKPCAFAAGAGGSPPGPIPATPILLLPAIAILAIIPIGADPAVRRLAAPPPPAQGPPAQG